MCAEQEWEIEMTRNETPETKATGNYMYYIGDLDVARSTYDWPESVTLGSAFTNTVYLDANTTLLYSGNYFYASGNSTTDGAEYENSLVTLVGSTFSFTWRGVSCGTAIFTNFESSTISSKIYTSSNGDSGTYSLSTTGGKIYAKNYTSSTSSPTSGYTVLSQTSSTSATITAYFKNYYYYYTSANTGYHLVKINNNGTTSTSSSVATFTSVTSDKYFYAYYAANSYSVLFDGNGSTSGSTSNMTDLYYDITYTLNENGFARLGYTFIGWNTEADGSGTSYTNEEEFSNLTYEDGGTVTLYAQWEENKVTINITKVSSETSTDEDENTVYTYLEGVEFSLYMLICEDETHDHDTDLIDTGSYDITCWELIGTYTTGSDGTFTLSDLPITGIYRLVETKTVEDYLLPSGQWKIEFDYGNLTDDESVIDYNGQGVKITAIGNPPALSLQIVSTDDTETDILYLYNSSSYDVPTTGSFETNNFYKIGTTLIVFGLCVIVIAKLKSRKRRVSVSKIKSLKKSVHSARRIIDNWDKKK